MHLYLTTPLCPTSTLNHPQRYPCGEDDCMELAALSIFIEHGKFAPENLKDRLDRYLPAKFASGPKVDAAAVVAKLTEKCSALKFRSRADAEQEYLKFVKEWQVYGSSFFFVEPQMSVRRSSVVRRDGARAVAPHPRPSSPPPPHPLPPRRRRSPAKSSSR
jgi:hypothetical protein